MDVLSNTPLMTLVLIAMAAGYLLGSIPFGLVITRMAGLGDIRNIGSGNIGATNVLRTGRKDLALATLLLDAGKAGLAFWLMHVCATALSGFSKAEAFNAAFVGGAAAFFGHCFPVWLKFKGGKGVATFLGLLLGAMWPVGVAFGATWLATAGAFRMSSLAALTATALAPLFVAAMGYGPVVIALTTLLAALIFWRHSANISRILKGVEPKIGQGKEGAARAEGDGGGG